MGLGFSVVLYIPLLIGNRPLPSAQIVTENRDLFSFYRTNLPPFTQQLQYTSNIQQYNLVKKNTVNR